MNQFPGSGIYDRMHAVQDMRAAQGEYTGPQAESRYVIPRFVERTSQGIREYDPYAKLFEERVIFLGVQIDDASANDVMAQLLCLESMDPDRDISVYINSPGGSFTALTAIYDTMQYVKPDIQTVCMGQAASAAAVLLAAGTPGKLMALPNARVLIHQPYSETGRGQVSDLEIAAVTDACHGVLPLRLGDDWTSSPAAPGAALCRRYLALAPVRAPLGTVHFDVDRAKPCQGAADVTPQPRISAGWSCPSSGW